MRTSAVVLIAAVAALAVASLSRPAARPGFPTFVHLPADQARHASAGNEWWYTIGHIRAGRHQYGYEVQLVASGVVQIGFTDVSAGRYASHQHTFPPNQISVSTTALSVRTPVASLAGPMNDMHLSADLPNGIGTLRLRLRPIGPTLYGNGTGRFPFLGGTSYYYSLPRLQTTGTLILRDKSTRVNGSSWLDRQWGTWDWGKVHRWTWMALQLGNGQTLSLWDMFDADGETHRATVLSADGSERVVSVKPLATHATDFRTSGATGQRYAGKWTVEVPTLQAKLTVIAKPVLQEIDAGAPFSPGINEAAATVAGTYAGRPVTGLAYVEQFGIWR